MGEDVVMDMVVGMLPKDREMISFPIWIRESLVVIVWMGEQTFCIPRFMRMWLLFVIIYLSHSCWHVFVFVFQIFCNYGCNVKVEVAQEVGVEWCLFKTFYI